ncbi:hypothetical protein MVI01_31390 [Myxococcus virescens]|uniref:Uncharacterized protein n=1 Tax=Myxococcus virescens TaxID=83456 RepID=A0A511HCZ8_9BACT|nr:hypothetical protein MVI01_31390 [Myxococcus virescens]
MVSSGAKAYVITSGTVVGKMALTLLSYSARVMRRTRVAEASSTSGGVPPGGFLSEEHDAADSSKAAETEKRKSRIRKAPSDQPPPDWPPLKCWLADDSNRFTNTVRHDSRAALQSP